MFCTKWDIQLTDSFATSIATFRSKYIFVYWCSINGQKEKKQDFMGIFTCGALAFNRILIGLVHHWLCLSCVVLVIVSIMLDIDYSIKATLSKTTHTHNRIQSFKSLHLCTLHYHLSCKRAIIKHVIVYAVIFWAKIGHCSPHPDREIT